LGALRACLAGSPAGVARQARTPAG